METIKYVIDGITKFSEIDFYDDGCQPNTGCHYSIDYKIQSGDLNKVIQDFMSFTGCDDKKSVLIDSCEVDGRIDIQVMENANGDVPSKMEIENWKKGKCVLYSVIYTAYVERHAITEPSLVELLGKNASEYQTY